MQTTKMQRVVTLILALIFAGSTISVMIFYVTANKQQANEINDLPTMSTTTTLENFEPVTSVTSLQAIDLIEGSGATVQSGATVTVNYIGALAANGVVFESSYNNGQPVTFSLDEVITGWTLGLPGMKVGGTRRLLIPTVMAYGANSPSAAIPANADLVFDVELIAIN